MRNLAMTNDGGLVAWGMYIGEMPANLTNVTAIAAGMDFNLALRADGTVAAWGNNTFGQTDVPAELTNVVAIAAGDLHALALRKDGTVVSWGYNWAGQTNVPPDLTTAMAVAAGSLLSMALRNDGTVVAWGDNTYGQCSVPAGLSNVMAVAAGYSHSIALRNDGAIVAWGRNNVGQTNVPSWLGPVKLIAAGANQTLVSMFSPLVQYPVTDASKDLLLIYNTHSADSTVVKAYYLAHRPMVSNANVLGISFSGFFITNYPGTENWFGATNITSYEPISPPDFTNQVLNPVLGWLASNPTKRPQYVVLLLDVPSRVNERATSPTNFPFYGYVQSSPSVSYQLATKIPGCQPCVTHINMDGTNDCIAYIDKLAAIGSAYSPGRLLISASAGDYGNTNYTISY